MLTRRSLIQGVLSMAALAPLGRLRVAVEEPESLPDASPVECEEDALSRYQRLRREKELAFGRDMVSQMESRLWAAPDA